MDIITGGAGLLGTELTFQLLRAGEEVCTIVRPSRQQADVRQRQLNSIAQLHPETPLSVEERRRLKVVDGDVSFPLARLSPSHVRTLRGAKPRRIWNCAADIRYDPRFEASILGANVTGVKNVSALATAVETEWLHHVSTAFISPVRDGIAFEELLAATLVPAGRNLYEQSKIWGELVLYERAQVPWCVHRTAILVGPDVCGRLSDSVGYFGFLRGLFCLRDFLAQPGNNTLSNEAFRIPGVPYALLNLVPVDFVVRELLEISDLLGLASGDIFHVVDGQPAALDEHLKLIGDCLDWEELRWTDMSVERLGPLERIFAASMAKFQMQYVSEDVRFAVNQRGRFPRSALRPGQLRAQILSAYEAWQADSRGVELARYAIRKRFQSENPNERSGS